MSLECGAAGAAMDEYVDDSTTCKPVDSINLGVGTPAHSDSAVRPTTQTLARADRLALALFRRQLATGLLLQRHVVPGEVRTQACVLYCTPDFTYLWWFESVLVGKKKGIALADSAPRSRFSCCSSPSPPCGTRRASRLGISSPVCTARRTSRAASKRSTATSSRLRASSSRVRITRASAACHRSSTRTPSTLYARRCAQRATRATRIPHGYVKSARDPSSRDARDTPRPTRPLRPK